MTQSANANSTSVRNQFDEIFEVEVDGWCYGLTHFPGEINPSLVHVVVREFRDLFNEAVENNFVFNVLDLSVRVSRASKYLVPEKEIAFAIIYNLPNPYTLDEEGQFVVAQLVDQVEQAYGGAVSRIQTKWNLEMEKKLARKAQKKAA